MTNNENDIEAAIPHTQDGIPMVVNGQRLSDTAIQALREARDRKNEAKTTNANLPAELNGPKGVEPTRYGDWERDGRVIDF
ncbi:MAG: DUF1674 domain-containing protein [Aquisalinus sp.]|nr:DUF1674 domain-containing protein [Aquisalinus sp.]